MMHAHIYTYAYTYTCVCIQTDHDHDHMHDIYIYILYMSIRAISRIDVSFKERELQGNDHDLRMPKFIGRGA